MSNISTYFAASDEKCVCNKRVPWTCRESQIGLKLKILSIGLAPAHFCELFEVQCTWVYSGLYFYTVQVCWSTPVQVYWSIIKYTEVYWSILQYTEVYWSILQYTSVYWSILKYTEVYWSILKYTEVYWKYVEAAYEEKRSHFTDSVT